MKYKAKLLIKVIAFLCILGALIYLITPVFTNKNVQLQISTYNDLPKNSVDVLFSGSSRTGHGVYPMVIWNAYGIASYNIAMDGQTLPLNYYGILSAIERQTPKLVVLEITNVYRPDLLERPERLRQWLDHSNASVSKLLATIDLMDSSKWLDHVFSILYYHSRWKDLTERDYVEPYSVAYGAVMKNTLSVPDKAMPLADPDDQTGLADFRQNMDYVDKIVDLCKKRGIELLLVNPPTYNTQDSSLDSQRIWNSFPDYAAEKGVQYLNCLYQLDAIGIDPATDFQDRWHLNVSGAAKYSLFIGEYIARHYDIPDHRGEARYAQWDVDFKAFNRYADKLYTDLMNGL